MPVVVAAALFVVGSLMLPSGATATEFELGVA